MSQRTPRKLGQILRVKLHNFVTYYDVEFQPGPMLNVVLGPNGTGKSTIVCALVLGLGGQPKDLGRAKDISEYVNHTKDSGFVEIELAGRNDSTIVIKRTIFKADNKSKWRINGKLTDRGSVLEKLKKLNVQVSNLCQFLPQDRVGEFARMSPPELLTCTQQAVGSDQLLMMHRGLIQLKKEDRELGLACGKRAEQLQRLKDMNDKLQQDVMRFRERERVKEQLDKLNMKKPWVVWREADEKREEAEKERDAAAQAVRDHERTAKPDLDLKKKIQKRLDAFNSRKKALSSDITKTERVRQRLVEQCNEMATSIDEAIESRNGLENSEQTRKKKLDEALLKREQILERIDQEQHSAAEGEARKQELEREYALMKSEEEKIKDALDDLRQRSGQIRYKKDGFRVQLQRIQDTANQRTYPVQKDFRHAFRAYNWINQNESRFQQRVYGPSIMHINVTEPRYANLIETVVANRWKENFVVTNEHDRRVLMEELERNQQIYINVSTVPDQVRTPTHVVDIRVLQQRYNALCWMDELIVNTPAPILHVLLDNVNLDRILVGSDKMSRTDVNNVFRDYGDRIGQIVTPTTVYRFSRSSYGSGKSSTLQFATHPQAKYIRSVNVEEMSRLQGKIAECDERLAQFRPEEQRLVDMEKDINQRIRANRQGLRSCGGRDANIRSYKQSLKRLDNRITQLSREVDNQQSIEEATRAIAELVKKRAKLPRKILQCLQKVCDLVKETDLLHVEMQDVKDELDVIDHRLREFDHTKTRLTREMQEKERIYRQCYDEARALKREAQQACPMTPELQEVFEELPETLMEIDAQIAQKQARIDRLFDFNPDIIRQYDARCAQIAKLEAAIESERDDIARKKEEIQQLRSKWEPEVEDIVCTISDQFAKFFKAIGCQGRVDLDRQDDDFEHWGIKPMVAFRKGLEVQQLDQFTQSGGERSVSTMLYMASLHSITKCPFRLVDEINQGMDSRNERMIFDVLKSVTCTDGSPQFFLITPKLLPGLEFTKHMKVINIMNGPYFVQQEEWIQSQSVLSAGGR